MRIKIGVIFGVRFERRNVDIKAKTYIKTETCKLYSGVFWVFLPNIIKINLCNSELYRFKVGAFFETQCSSNSYNVAAWRLQMQTKFWAPRACRFDWIWFDNNKTSPVPDILSRFTAFTWLLCSNNTQCQIFTQKFLPLLGNPISMEDVPKFNYHQYCPTQVYPKNFILICPLLFRLFCVQI